MRHQPKVALFIFGPLGRTSRLRGQRPGPELLVHGQRQRPNLLAFLAAVAESVPGTRTRVNVVALPILVIEPRCPLWAISGHQSLRASHPLYSRKRTWFSTIVMSALCQKQTLGRLLDMIDAVPGKADRLAWDWHETFPQTIFPICREYSRAADRLAHRRGTRLSVAAGAHHRRLLCRWRARHFGAPHRTVAV